MLEEEILYWLAIEREAVTLSDLRENIVHSPTGCATSLLSEVELA